MKKLQNAKSIGEKLKTKGLMSFVSFFFHVIWNISNFDAKHLMQAFYTELTLLVITLKGYENGYKTLSLD